MPGRTTAEAFEAFIGPLQSAITCLGPAKVTVSAGGRGKSQGVHAWTLNSGKGMPLIGGLLLHATMNYEFLRDDRLEGGPWRCTTRGYMYSVDGQDGRELIAYHWHPVGASHFKAPHLHIGTPALAPSGVFTAGSHFPTGRLSLERFIRFVITDLRVPPHRTSWDKDLQLSEGVFEVYRSWSTTPPSGS